MRLGRMLIKLRRAATIIEESIEKNVKKLNNKVTTSITYIIIIMK